jgi:tRNA nucleotidyltransferase/poly(A) polymerase
LSKDITINAIYYNIKQNIIEDPLDGLHDLKNGIIVTPLKKRPFKSDYFRVLRVFKISAKYSLKISTYIEEFIKKELIIIKV